LPLSEAVAKAVGSYDEENSPCDVSVAINAKAGVFFAEASRLQFGERGFDVVDFKEASFLAWITSVFGESDLDIVSAQDGRFAGCFIPRENAESHHGLVKGQRVLEILDWKVHRVVGVWPRSFEYCSHVTSTRILAPAGDDFSHIAAVGIAGGFAFEVVKQVPAVELRA
jgi:hypothetical protein